MSPRSILVTLGVLAGVCLLVVLFGLAFQRETRQIHVGPNAEARRNPYLAAQRILTRLGVSSTARDGSILLRLPETTQTLVLLGDHRQMSADQVAGLLEWVNAGGYLVVGAARDERDPLLGEIGVSRGLRPGASEGDSAESRTIQAPPWSGAGDLDVVLDPYRLTDAHSRAGWAAPPESPAVLYIPYGRGAITALVDTSFLTNDRIEGGRSADLMWHLITGPDHRREVTWVAFENYPGLLTLAYRYGRPALVSAVVVLLAFLWRVAVRVGPVLYPPPAGRRGITEHVTATGRFLWRTRRIGVLLDAAARAAGQAPVDAEDRQQTAGRARHERGFVAAVAETERARRLRAGAVVGPGIR